MASRKLKVERVDVSHFRNTKTNTEQTELVIVFSRKLTQLEISGVKAVLQGEIQ